MLILLIQGWVGVQNLGKPAYMILARSLSKCFGTITKLSLFPGKIQQTNLRNLQHLQTIAALLYVALYLISKTGYCVTFMWIIGRGYRKGNIEVLYNHASPNSDHPLYKQKKSMVSDPAPPPTLGSDVTLNSQVSLSLFNVGLCTQLPNQHPDNSTNQFLAKF